MFSCLVNFQFVKDYSNKIQSRLSVNSFLFLLILPSVLVYTSNFVDKNFWQKSDVVMSRNKTIIKLSKQNTKGLGLI